MIARRVISVMGIEPDVMNCVLSSGHFLGCSDADNALSVASLADMGPRQICASRARELSDLR